MQLERHNRDAVDVLTLAGPWTRSRVLREAVRELVRLGEPIVVLDLRGVEDLTSSCLGELVASRDRIRRAGGLVKLVVSDGQYDRLRAAGVDGLFPLFRSEEQAIESFEAETMTVGVP